MPASHCSCVFVGADVVLCVPRRLEEAEARWEEERASPIEVEVQRREHTLYLNPLNPLTADISQLSDGEDRGGNC